MVNRVVSVFISAAINFYGSGGGRLITIQPLQTAIIMAN